jgi:hypothetical protein
MTSALNAPLTASTQWLERTLDDSANRRLSLPETFLATDAILRLMANVASGLVVHEKANARMLGDVLPFLATENLLMAGVRKGGDRQALHEIIRTHSLAARSAFPLESRTILQNASRTILPSRSGWTKSPPSWTRSCISAVPLSRRTVFSKSTPYPKRRRCRISPCSTFRISSNPSMPDAFASGIFMNLPHIKLSKSLQSKRYNAIMSMTYNTFLQMQGISSMKALQLLDISVAPDLHELTQHGTPVSPARDTTRIRANTSLAAFPGTA